MLFEQTVRLIVQKASEKSERIQLLFQELFQLLKKKFCVIYDID